MPGFAKAVQSLPSAVHVALDYSVRTYWLDRAQQALSDSYMGIPMMKFPEDLRVYEHVLWANDVDVVIEVGTHLGGSALWFRDRLLALARYRQSCMPLVVTIDSETAGAAAALRSVDPEYMKTIRLISADIRDPALTDFVAEQLPAGARCMVVEDSAHTYETTRAALDALSRFVSVGGVFVVEDGCVDIDEMRADPDWPRGVLPAIADWLQSEVGAAFTVRRDLELYGISCHPRGFLQRVS